jgi:hypothetical protein
VRFLNGDAAAAEPDLARAVRMLPGRADVSRRHARVLCELAMSGPSSPDPEPEKEVPR